MALITCPECKQQISDQATSCPNCGYPLAQSSDPLGCTPQNTEPEPMASTTVIAKPAKKKRAVAIIGAVCAILACVVVFIMIQVGQKSKAAEARETYISNLNLFSTYTLSGAAEAEATCNLTKKVWYDTIYENIEEDTILYTTTNGIFHEDFNDSLTALYSSDKMVEMVKTIKENQTQVDELYKALLSPTSEFEKCYEAVENLYDVYRKFTNLAISPSGSLQTYAANFSEYDDEFMECRDKLELLIPEE